ncbi:hypothetical protein [Gracilibacillus saliphilus]|uniref:hypothetical protein n=1 Tax=Gracilibacillus saliphilus TaxID=543890 RepID=UPI0013D43133|nr:hypothetical protein [Gracilibacillus saliphilus]
MLKQKLKELGWKRLLMYMVISFILFAIIGFTIIFGGLVSLDKLDDRYQQPEAYENATYGKG